MASRTTATSSFSIRLSKGIVDPLITDVFGTYHNNQVTIGKLLLGSVQHGDRLIVIRKQQLQHLQRHRAGLSVVLLSSDSVPLNEKRICHPV